MELFNKDDFKGLYNCKECKANTICTSCKMANYNKSGDITKQNLYFCEVNWWKYLALSSRYNMDLFNPITKEERDEIANNIQGKDMKFAMIFGAKSYEHEISIVSAIALKKILKNEPLFIFCDKISFILSSCRSVS